MPAFDWPALFVPPTDLSEHTGPAWLLSVAARLISRARLQLAGKQYRFQEIEAYYNGPGHEDPFAHRDPMQRHCGRWYFHRTGGVYRGGSFKGVDLAFGDGVAFAGFLVRGLEKPNGTVIDGPSVTVDHLLAETKTAKVSELDAACGTSPVWTAGHPLELVWDETAAEVVPFTSARVGLGLKKYKYAAADPGFKFVFRRYRYLANPLKTSKGKALMALAMLADGATEAEVAKATGSPASAVKRYAADHRAGTAETDTKPYYGTDWTTSDLAKFHGLWSQRFRTEASS